jgi:hypothetical protein
MEIFENVINGGVGRSHDVRIFNPEDERSFVALCKDVIKEGGPGISDMEKPGRGRGKANPYRCIHSMSLTIPNFGTQAF